MSLDNPDLRWVPDANIIEREDENGIRWRFESGRWTEVVQAPSIEPRRYVSAEYSPSTRLYSNMEEIRVSQVSPENLDVIEEPIRRVLPNFNEDFMGRSSISNATIDGSRIVAGGIREAPPTPGIYTNLMEGIDLPAFEEAIKMLGRPILHRKQNVYTKEEGGNWYFKSITSGKECGPYGTEEEAKKHERNINGK